jgi:hypothetical protein
MDSFLVTILSAMTPLTDLAKRILELLPSLLGAVVLILVGTFVGRWLRHMVEHGLKLAKLDMYTDMIGLGKVFTRLGLGHSLTNIIGFLVYWFVIGASLLSAADTVRLVVVSEFLDKVIRFMPNLIASVVVLGSGLFLGQFVGTIAHRAATANNIRGAEMLSRITYGVLVIFAGVLSLRCLGIDISFLTQYMQIVVGCIGLGVAIAFGVAFGIAGKDAAGRMINGVFKKA